MNPVPVKWNPALFTSTRTGKRYAVSGDVWIEVPDNTTREDLPKYMLWESSNINLSLERSDARSWEVEGSKGKVYTVRESQGQWSCTCAGFMYRRKCRHIEEQRS